MYTSFILSAKAKKLLYSTSSLTATPRLYGLFDRLRRHSYSLLLLREFFFSTKKRYQTLRTLEPDEIHENHVRMKANFRESYKRRGMSLRRGREGGSER